MRGYFGIGIENSKHQVNLGTLWRTASNFGAAFMFTVGQRYKMQKADTEKSYKHIPFFQYDDLDSFKRCGYPKDCQLIGMEFPSTTARPINNYIHPERCIYILGAEDNGLSSEALSMCNGLVYIPSVHSLNVAVAGSIIMYDRIQKCSKNL